MGVFLALLMVREVEKLISRYREASWMLGASLLMGGGGKCNLVVWGRVNNFFGCDQERNLE